MYAVTPRRAVLAVVLCLTLAISSLTVIGLSAPASLPAGSASAPLTTAETAGPSSLADRVTSELASQHVPLSDVFLPNFNARVSAAGGVISPLYSEAPAPMGIGDFGVQASHGVNVGTVSYTSSVEGVLTLDQLNSTYLDGQGPDTVSIQLNTVLTNVQLFGTVGYQFWIQNVPEYIPHLDQLSLLDNVWNFSNSQFDLTQNSIYSARGVAIAPVFYYDNGPTFHISMPFTVRVYNNATLFHDRPAVYLNYSVTNSMGVTVSGSYDRIVFNSTVMAHPKVPAATPDFQIDGQQYGANGYLPNDAELMLGGSDDGDTTSVTAVQGTMQLLTLPNGTSSYLPVPSAFDFGTDTGETTEGMAEWASGGATPMAHLGPGPSYLIPLWGAVGASFGHIVQTLQVAPSNAFVFVSPGPKFDQNTAQWAPVRLDGGARYELPAGEYSYKVLLSEYRPVTFTLNGTAAMSVTLVSAPHLGIYTPLWATGNAQLAAISQPGGTGTAANPYVLDNAPGTISPLFGQMNDFQFPVFPGIQLVYTSAFVTITDAPSFLVQYSLAGQAALLTSYGLPTFNYLQIEFENATHVSLVDNPVISGWFSADNIGMSLGDVLLWNSSHDLIAGNDFEDMGQSVYVAFGSDDVFWGNSFTVAVPPCADPYGLLNYSDQSGIELSANGDLVYNNYFDVPLGADTPTYSPATYLPISFHDTWNVSKRSASDVQRVNGFNLSGNILGLSWQGGNFWSNYGSPTDPYGQLPYNDGRQITHGGDYLPLLPYAIHAITFTETGLPAGTFWTVTINGTQIGSRGSSLTVWEPRGDYTFRVGGPGAYTPTPRFGMVDVVVAPVSVSIVWT